MKRQILLAAVLGLIAGPTLADPVVGLWQTRPDDNGNTGYIRIAPCGESLCGVLVKSFDKEGKAFVSDAAGRKIVWGMRPGGAGAYAAKIQLSGDHLAVSGCVLGGLICRNGGNWVRVK